MNRRNRFEGRVNDEFFCFYIDDFNRGDKVIAKTGRTSRAKGIVKGVDKSLMTILFEQDSGEMLVSKLNDIIYLSR